MKKVGHETFLGKFCQNGSTKQRHLFFLFFSLFSILFSWVKVPKNFWDIPYLNFLLKIWSSCLIRFFFFTENLYLVKKPSSGNLTLRENLMFIQFHSERSETEGRARRATGLECRPGWKALGYLDGKSENFFLRTTTTTDARSKMTQSDMRIPPNFCF